jgi:alpha-1,2-mannosyltransferase
VLPHTAPAEDEEDPSVRAQAELDRTDAASPSWARRLPWYRILGIAGLAVCALAFALSLTSYAADQAVHRGLLLTWYDLRVYNDAGLITRELPSILYTWELKIGVQFTYTPFAAIVFAGGSLLPLMALRWVMTIGSVAAVPLTVWLTLGGMGRKGAGRLAVTLVVSALALWTEPVIKALFLGQIEPLLLLLVVWDLTRPDGRKWKGAGIGLAAGIKLVPLIFIPYLLLSGKFRQAAVAAATFAATVLIGFVVLPGPSAAYWLTGYFMRPGRTGGVDSLVNQSLLGSFARQFTSIGQAQAVWLPVALGVAVIGLVGGALLARADRPVQGWTLVGITAVLVSPISWDHHWVWIIPFLAMLAGVAMTSRLVARIGCIVALLLTTALLAAYPWSYSGPQSWVPRRGLLGWFVRPPSVTKSGALHGWELLTWNLFVVVGCLIYLAILAWVWPAWRRRSRPPEPPPPAEPPRPAEQAPELVNPISALLARADAVLKGNGHSGALVGSDASKPNP